MLRRLSRWSRPFSALFALWFAVVLGDPGVLHSCPMHGAHAMASGGHASHAAAAHHQSHDSAPTKNSSGDCSCVGQCCAAAAVASLPAVASFAVPAHVARPSALPEYPRDDIPSSPHVRLPFANGPPQA
ncbi:MAG: hypothetical protein ABI969_17710 [bacterium]